MAAAADDDDEDRDDEEEQNDANKLVLIWKAAVSRWS